MMKCYRLKKVIFKKSNYNNGNIKGVALTVDSWKKLKDYIEEIDEAIENA